MSDKFELQKLGESDLTVRWLLGSLRAHDEAFKSSFGDEDPIEVSLLFNYFFTSIPLLTGHMQKYC